MTATTTTRRRAWVPMMNMLLALTALVIAVIALAVAPTEVLQPSTAADVVTAGPAATIPPQSSPAAELRIIDGCDRVRVFSPC